MHRTLSASRFDIDLRDENRFLRMIDIESMDAVKYAKKAMLIL